MLCRAASRVPAACAIVVVFGVATSTAKTVAQYLKALSAEQRTALTAVKTVNANLPDGYEEGMLYGMIGWYMPLADFPDTTANRSASPPSRSRRSRSPI